jgi:hypothetical protein
MIRTNLHIGTANTPLWRHLKSLCILACLETKHTKGDSPHACRLCSMPVCNTCVVKQSFGKRENTFGNRKRQLCEHCWLSGNPHKQRLLHVRHETIISVDYTSMNLCRCTASDGFLCSSCKDEQNDVSKAQQVRCAGRNCSQILASDEQGGRICLWCDLALPGARSKTDRRRREFNPSWQEDSALLGTDVLGLDMDVDADSVYASTPSPGLSGEPRAEGLPPTSDATAEGPPGYTLLDRPSQAEHIPNGTIRALNMSELRGLDSSQASDAPSSAG